MKRGHDRRRNPLDLIFMDEIGIVYGVFGNYRLRSAYQPIFAVSNSGLVPVAVEALVKPFILGKEIGAEPFFGAVLPEDRLFVETMCRMLHLRNFHNIGVETLDLFFNYDPSANDHHGRALAEIRWMARHLESLELTAGMLVCEITEKAAPDDDVLRSIAKELRRHGIRVALDDFGAGHSTEHRLGLIEPDIVKIDGQWFGELCRHGAGQRLFGSLLSLLHDRGARVLVEGIQSGLHLRVAMDGGADLLQGFLLGPPALAGTIFNEKPRPLEAFLGTEAKIIPLFG